MNQKKGPLAGVRIVDLSSVVMGAYATRIFGDLGADIIKVEVGEGDIIRHAGPSPAPGMGAIYVGLNRNKRSVLLDLKSGDGMVAMAQLLQRADVFFTNVRMDGLTRLGLGYDAVRSIKPDIIYVHCAGYGADGPYAGMPAYDDLIQGVSGIADLARINDGGPPRYSPSLVADKVGGLHAAYATTSALYARAMTGEGQFVEAPMFEAVTSFNMVENLFGHTFDPPRAQMGYPRSVSPYRKPFATKDGFIGVLPYNDRQWEMYFELGGRPDLMASDPRFRDYASRSRNSDALYELAAELAKSRTTDEWLALLQEADIPAMRCSTLNDLLDEPHLAKIGFFERRQHPQIGDYLSVKHPVTFSETPAQFRIEPPTLGQHTREVLEELGLAADVIDRMTS